MAQTDVTDPYAEHQSLYRSVPVPDHVPSELVVDFDYLHPPGMADGENVYTAWKRLHEGPDIVWTSRNGGHWLLTRGEDIKFVQENYETFSHEVFTIPRGSSPIHMPPLTVDPPLHARYRATLNPFFTPTRVKSMREKTEDLTRDLIGKIKPLGRCEFVNDFARVMPVIMFLGIVDLPLDQREQFVDWAVTFITSPDSRVKLGPPPTVFEYAATSLD
ncbi:MAG: hypothetical protein NVS3B5_00760 [Sphingomicrobium sp.]